MPHCKLSLNNCKCDWLSLTALIPRHSFPLATVFPLQLHFPSIQLPLSAWQSSSLVQSAGSAKMSKHTTCKFRIHSPYQNFICLWILFYYFLPRRLYLPIFPICYLVIVRCFYSQATGSKQHNIL